MNSRCLKLFLGVVLLLGLSVNAAAEKLRQVPQLSDLKSVSEQARKLNLPILLVVSQHHCPFCQQLKREVLDPMMLSGQYTDKVVMVELLMDDETNIINREGKSVYPGSVIADYKVWVTPTLLFIDYQGKEVEKRMIGVNTIEMYGFYLDQAIDAALVAVKQGEPYAYKVTKKDINGSD
jgi:thioredoxin-related protein